MIQRGWCDLLELGAQPRGEEEPATYKNQVAATCIDTTLADAESMPYFKDRKGLDLSIPQHKGIHAMFDFPASEMRALQLVVPLAPKYSSAAGMIAIDKAVLDSAIDSEGNFRGPNFLDHTPECSTEWDPGKRFIQKSEQDATALLATAPGKGQWKDFSNKVFSEINTIAETALLWSASPRAEQKPWTTKHIGRGQIPVFKKRAIHGTKKCDSQGA